MMFVDPPSPFGSIEAWRNLRRDMLSLLATINDADEWLFVCQYVEKANRVVLDFETNGHPITAKSTSQNVEPETPDNCMAPELANYANLARLFADALSGVDFKGMNQVDILIILIRPLMQSGLKRPEIKALTPHFKRFHDELISGKISIFQPPWCNLVRH